MPELEEQFRQLADDVRASAPEPRDAFATQLERRVEAGFPKPERQRSRSWFWAPTLAVATCALVALVFAVGAIDNGSDEDEGSSGSSEVQMGEEAGGGSAPGPADESATDMRPLVQAAPGPVAPGSTRSRAIERRTQLELETGADAFDDDAAGVLRIADASGTIVQRSSLSERGGRGVATFDLRVPASRLDEVLADLSALAKVTARTADADDITASVVSARDRLQDARAQRAALLRALGRADTGNEAAAIRQGLTDVRRRIAGAERDVRRLRARTDRARVAVTLSSTGRTGDGGAWTPGDALGDAGRVLEVMAGVALIAGAVVLPLVLLYGLAVGTSRIARRRRRDAALG